MGYLGATLTQVFTHADGADESLRDVTIAQMGNGARECGWRHAPESGGGFWRFWKSQWVELSCVLTRKKTLDFRLLAEALWRVPLMLGCGRWKSQNRKNVYLSPYVEEPLNSKVIKSLVPELRSRVFRVTRFLCSMYICYEHSMYVSRSHGYVTVLVIYLKSGLTLQPSDHFTLNAYIVLQCFYLSINSIS